MKISTTPPLEKFKYILAEELNGFFPQGNYNDLLQLESDIAQISSLILLFSESYGSAAELGAFAIKEQISQKLLVVIDNKNYGENSFIKLGPLRYLENKEGDNSVCVLQREDLEIQSISNLEELNIKTFQQILQSSIITRNDSIINHSTFSKKDTGHLIKILTGIIQWYGALTKTEIETILYCLKIDIQHDLIDNYLLCARFADWIEAEKHGVHTYYVATQTDKMAVKFSAKHGGSLQRIKWQTRIREYWKENDPMRFSTISRVLGR